MAAFDWFPWYPVHYRRATRHLTDIQDLIYRRLIDEYMETREPLPDNDIALASIARVSIDVWQMARAIVVPFFRITDGKLWHKKCDEILGEQSAVSEKKARAGAAGAAKRWNKVIDKPSEYSNSHEDAKAVGLANDGTLQDKRLQDSKEEDDEGSSSSVECRPKIQFDYALARFENISDLHREAWAAAYPAINVVVEVNKAAVWLTANPKNRKQNLERFLANWMAKQQERAPAQGGGLQGHHSKTALPLTPEEQKKNRDWYLRIGKQHPLYNPEGIRTSGVSA